MTYIASNEEQIKALKLRLLVAASFVLFCFALLVARFIWLQVVQKKQYTIDAENNRIAIVPIVPNRGLIKDKNGIILAHNYSAFTLEIAPQKINGKLDDLITQLSTIVNIEARDKKRFKQLQEENKHFASIPLKLQLTDEEVAKLAANKYRFQGVEVNARLFRSYPWQESTSHLIGHIGRISIKDREKIEKVSDANNQGIYDPRKDAINYLGTEHIGKLGVEQSYEYELHGMTGSQKVEVNSAGKAIRALTQTPAITGNNIILSIDIKLQQLVEDLYKDRKGALVAIEPATGQILAFVSKPNFNPNLFVNGIDTENWKNLNENLDKPLLNRAIKGLYPPGSTYKPFMAMGALKFGLRTPEQSLADPGYFMLGSHRFRDDKVGGHGSVNMYKSIVQSCNTYYYVLGNQMGVDRIHDNMKPFGFGQITGIDLPGESKGTLPSKAWKQKAYKRPEQQKWYDGETISLAIGQGYNQFTPLQIAHATAILANNGIATKPKVVYQIENAINLTTTKQTVESTNLNLKPEHLDLVKKALVGVNIEGTGAAVFRGVTYMPAGKTGTAQVFTVGQNERYNSSSVAKNLKDHSLYMVFAPANQPKIAIALIVENGGFGAQAAVPIAKSVLDYYLEGKLPVGYQFSYPLFNQPMSPTLVDTINNQLNSTLKQQTK